MTIAAHDHVVHDHAVNVYGDDADLAEDVTEYLLAGLRRGSSAIVIATGDHLDAIDEGLSRGGVDPIAARRAGRYIAADAAETLAGCMDRGRVDRSAFGATVEPLVEHGAAAGRGVRAFGEMVSLLWDGDDAASAVALEDLWNDLLARRSLGLYCAYPEASLSAHGPLDAVRHMCAQHSTTVLPRSYQRPGVRRAVDARADVCSQVFLPHMLAIRPARRFVLDVLEAWGWEALSAEAALVVSELATNAVMHTCGPFRVALQRDATTVTVRVTDTSTVLPRRRAPGGDTAGGRGLLLVEGLSCRSGTDPAEDGKTVWADFELVADWPAPAP